MKSLQSPQRNLLLLLLSATAVLCLIGTVSAVTPSISLSTTQLTFSALANGAQPASQSFAVSTTSSTTFKATASGGTWLSVSPSTGTAPGSVTVSVNTAGLAAGKYSGQVTVTAGDGSSATTGVVLNVSTPALTVTPGSLAFSAAAGSTAQPLQSIKVSPSPSAPFTIAVQGPSWLKVTPSSASGGAIVLVAANVTGVPAGSYNAVLAVSANGLTVNVPVAVTVAAAGGPFRIVGWNDLGMHCFDGKDYSVFGVLPPYNTIHAQLVDTTGALITAPSGYTVTYQALRDPADATITLRAANKTNFWTFAPQLGLGSPAPDVGITGNAMPGLMDTPRPMTFSASDNTWVATGIPEMPYAENGVARRFPLMRLTARNSSGVVLATTDVVLPTSDEMSCNRCHASNSDAAAQPKSGWVNDPDPARDVKLNILRRHDDLNQASSLFQSAATQLGYNPAGLEATARSRPILCAQCHGSNALNMAGISGIQPLTTSMHKHHAPVVDPSTGATMDSSTTRATCYNCHPGPATKCLRGAMGNLKTSSGAYAIECQSCHGSLSAVADPTRTGWLTQPNCQACHTGLASSTNPNLVYTSAFSSGTTLRLPADTTFATNPNTPATGISLYRFSRGHGGLQCEACHGSTHAEFPTSQPNDNIQSLQLQGHTGPLAECATCHSTIPSTTNGGPHGMHPIGSTWVSRHQDVADSQGTASCQGCHGADYKGTILSRVQANRTLAGKSFAAGTIIGCYSCHNGPQGD